MLFQCGKHRLSVKWQWFVNQETEERQATLVQLGQQNLVAITAQKMAAATRAMVWLMPRLLNAEDVFDNHAWTCFVIKSFWMECDVFEFWLTLLKHFCSMLNSLTLIQIFLMLQLNPRLRTFEWVWRFWLDMSHMFGIWRSWYHLVPLLDKKTCIAFFILYRKVSTQYNTEHILFEAANSFVFL